MEADPAEDDDLGLEAVDVVSFGPPVVFMGFETLLFESIPVLTTSLNDQLNYHRQFNVATFLFVLCVCFVCGDPSALHLYRVKNLPLPLG